MRSVWQALEIVIKIEVLPLVASSLQFSNREVDEAFALQGRMHCLLLRMQGLPKFLPCAFDKAARKIGPCYQVEVRLGQSAFRRLKHFCIKSRWRNVK